MSASASKSTWRGVVTLKPNDHDLWALVRNRVEKKHSWEEIAAEIGCSADEIVEWVNAYKFPPKPTARTSKPITVAGEPVHSHRQLSAQFMAWKRAKDGAMRTRVNK